MLLREKVDEKRRIFRSNLVWGAFIALGLSSQQSPAQITIEQEDQSKLSPDIEEQLRRLDETAPGGAIIEDSPNGVYLAMTLNRPLEVLANSDRKNYSDTLLKTTLEVIEEHVGQNHGYDLSVTDIQRTSDDTESLQWRAEQVVHGNVVSSLRIEYQEFKDEEPRLHIEGILLNPDLPELNPSNWIAESDAIDRTVDSLRAFDTGVNSRWFEESVQSRSIKGKRLFRKERTPNGISVTPVYEVRGPDSIAEVNLYTGAVTARQVGPRKVSNQVKTNVCTPAGNDWWSTCTNDANQGSNPQVYTVFGEQSDGTRVCTAGPPFNLPVSTECLLPAYQKSHEVIRQSEDLLNDNHPGNCCSNMGETASFFGTSFKQLDVNAASPLPAGFYNADAYFAISGNPSRAMIVVDEAYELLGATRGWEHLIGHEWSHAYATYYGNQGTGLGSGYSDTDITLRSVAEGMSHVWAVLLDKQRFTGSWSWVMKLPDGSNFANINGSEKWANYQHNISGSAVANNGEIFTAFFKNMQSKGVPVSQLIKSWMRVSRNLKNTDSQVNDGMQGTASVNVYDFAQRTLVELQSYSSSNRKKGCESWEKFDLKRSGYQTQVCEPEEPDDIVPIFAYCTSGSDPAAVWTHNWDNGDFLSWTEILDSENGGVSYVLDGFLQNNVESQLWTAQNITSAQGQVKLRACRWNLSAANGKVCSSYSPARTVYDLCGTGGGN